jgi:hypothetical protein
VAGLSAAHLRRLADELDAEEKTEAEAELRAKVDRLEEAQNRGGLSDEQTTVLRRAEELLDELDRERDEDRGSSSSSDGSPTGSSSDDDAGEPEPKPAKTRPGRKSGAAYDWTVDDDGKVRKVDVATVWTGADEPDEVELPA